MIVKMHGLLFLKQNENALKRKTKFANEDKGQQQEKRAAAVSSKGQVVYC